MREHLSRIVAVLICFSSLVHAQHVPALQTDHLRFVIDPSDGHWELTDNAGQVTWKSSGAKPRFGEICINQQGKKINLDLAACTIEARDTALVARFKPVKDHPETILTITLKPIDQGRGVQFDYEAPADLNLEWIRLIDSLSIGASEKGYILTPTRMGLLIPADSGVAFARRFGTSEYEGCHMNMIGLVKSGATALVTWDDPYAAADLKSELFPTGPEKQILRASMVMRKSAKSATLRVGGKGDWNTIGAMYREIARKRGNVVTLAQKIQQNPARAKLPGASNVKLWACLSRQMNDESTKEERSKVNWTFDEAAQVAAHIKNDLKIEKVLFTIGGWTHRGYDNQHPDVLPAAPECGGDAELAKCAKRVMALGYLFCLHDNYQDMYRDAPSWDEKWLQRNPDGSVIKGGKWAGGRAYMTCAKLAVDLAKRPQNLPAVSRLTGADSYFIDTTYAVGPQECFSKDHPLTRVDDIRWKCELSDYARSVFPVFGSECGREWAIPHADFFEGLTGVSGGHYHDKGLEKMVGGTVVPIFEMVYRDCIAMYGKYGYGPETAAPYVLHHISIGRPLNYHSIGQHLYWKESWEPPVIKATPSVAEFKQAGPRRFAITYAWQVDEAISRDWNVFVHFNDAKDAIRFQNDHDPSPATSKWTKGSVKQGPFTLTVPAGLSGTFDVRIGMHLRTGDMRAVLACGHDKLQRTLIGKVKIDGDAITFTPAQQPASIAPNAALFVRGDNGWTQGMHFMDRFLKNTHEILSPLNEITSHVRMTRFEFLTDDRSVRRSIFGEGESAVSTIVNYGPGEYRYDSKFGGNVTLPAMGFAVETNAFVAFCATAWNGVNYDTPTLFAVRAMDGKLIGQSQKVKIFHAFGDPRIRLGAKEVKVAKEEIVTP